MKCKAATTVDGETARCTADAVRGGLLCHYHTKMAAGLLEPSPGKFRTNRKAASVQVRFEETL